MGADEASLGEGPPRESLARLFVRFLRFGVLAWGGPAAQIEMVRESLVEREGWITRERFNRVLAVYQALPGPEAHELCCYFGMLARGRLGSIVAGLGFMLPGLLLMLAASWLYLRFGLTSPATIAAFAGAQAAVCALIVRAVHRIGAHAVTTRPLLAIAVWTGVAELVGVGFGLTLAFAAAGNALTASGRRASLTALALLACLTIAFAAVERTDRSGRLAEDAPAASAHGQGVGQGEAEGGTLFVSGLRGGLLTFGGAYTAIPFVREDAVVRVGWMTDAQFLDGIAIGGVLPAPLVIFATFVGYVGGGLGGALLMTLGMFLPAFSFTLLGHGFFERVVDEPRVHALLDGVTAGVVGIIGATAISLCAQAIDGPATAAIFAASLATLYLWRRALATPVVVLGAALAGLALLG